MRTRKVLLVYHFTENKKEMHWFYETLLNCIFKISNLFIELNFNNGIYEAAKIGDIEIVKFFKKLGATDFNGAMWRAEKMVILKSLNCAQSGVRLILTRQ